MLNFPPIRVLSVLVLVLSFGTLLAQESKPVRVGILGIDNYQSVAYTQLFNDAKATGDLAGLKVVAAFPRHQVLIFQKALTVCPNGKMH